MPQAPARDTQKNLRAAQYVRMSTDLQKYSIENQAAAIAAFALQRNFTIVRTYSDNGRSGVRIDNREELKRLIADVQSGKADFDVVLVYDISRWGRFQDADEGAHYEFLCKDAGKKVFYCAELFENDGSLVSAILKNMKRVMAGEYSRELSTKVSVGQSRGARLGFFQGGHAGYGMRRQLIDENGTPKAILKLGQRKSLQTERIILVLGPPSELKIVRRIFESFVVRKKSRTQIANDLNAAGIKNALGNRWSMQAIDDILRNEKYIGNIVYGRGSVKLGQKRVNNPPETWVRREKALKGIVSPELFAKAQQRIAACLHRPTDQELLDKLSRVWRTKGTLSHKIIMNSKGVPHTSIYFSRFGSLTAAYERIGFQCKPQYQQTKLRNKIEAIIDSLADDIVSNVTKFGGRITYLRELHLLTINDTMTVTIGVATKVLDGTTRSPRWQIRRFKYKRADYFLIMKMDASKTEPDAYFLLPTSRLNRKANQKLRPSSPIFGELYRHDNLGALYRVWAMNHHTDKTPPEVFQATS